MKLRNEKGLFGIHPILFLAIFGALVIWASYEGYIKWKGPNAGEMAEEAADDVRKSVKKLVK